MGVIEYTLLDDQLASVIEKEIRPIVQSHGGDISFESYDRESKTLKVKLFGACSGCPIAFQTLTFGVLQILQKSFPEIKNIISL